MTVCNLSSIILFKINVMLAFAFVRIVPLNSISYDYPFTPHISISLFLIALSKFTVNK